LDEPLAEEGLTVRLPGGLPYGAPGAGLFEPPSSSIRAKASSSRRCSTKRLEDLEIIAIAIPSAAVISTQPNIVLEFMEFPSVVFNSGDLALGSGESVGQPSRAHFNISNLPPRRYHRAKTVCARNRGLVPATMVVFH